MDSLVFLLVFDIFVFCVTHTETYTQCMGNSDIFTLHNILHDYILLSLYTLYFQCFTQCNVMGVIGSRLWVSGIGVSAVTITSCARTVFGEDAPPATIAMTIR